MGGVLSTSANGVLGLTSPLTYQVSARLEALILVLSGVFLFGEVPISRNVFGINITTIGIIWYTELKLDEQA